MGTPTAECPRFPGEGPSSQGQSGPKGRPPGAPEGRQVDIPAPRAAGARATAPEGPAGFWTPPSGREAGEAPSANRCPQGALEKRARRKTGARPYRRPTQVGRQSMPRRTGQPRPRNSAKQPRNFGRRGAPPKGGAAETRPRRLFTKNTGLCKAARRRIGSDACPVPEGHAEPSASRRSGDAKPR